MEYVFLFLLFFVCVAFLLIIRSKSVTIKNIEQNNLVYRKHIDYLEKHRYILNNEIEVYKERINYLLKELDKEPDEILFKIESPNKESRFSKERSSDPNDVITFFYKGYKVEQNYPLTNIQTEEAKWEQIINQINCQ